MSRDKRIEEIAKELCNSTMCDLETYNNCRMPQGNCSRCKRVSEDLYNAGYRKASDVAEEIFAEIENINAHGDGYYEYWKDWLAKLAELKKKYTEEGK